MKRVAPAAVLCCLASTGCGKASPKAVGPVGQLLLHVDTDAPVDDGSTSLPAIGEPLPLFDRLRFDVAPPDPSIPCNQCSNDFAVTSDAFSSGSVSIGIPLPPRQDGWTVRLRLYPLALASPDGEPNPAVTIDATFALPALAAEGVIEATAFLSTDTTGQPVGQDTPAALTQGPPQGSAVGSWPGAILTDCKGTPPDGMVCVPGGAFWMGSSDADFADGTVAGWRRLVVVSPFFVDETEMTVGVMRNSLGIAQPIAWSGRSDGVDGNDWCTYTPSPGPRDDLPANCMAQVQGATVCQYRLGDLPTEAQYEYMASGLRGQPLVWGTELPSCQDAIWGRNGYGYLAIASPKTCLPFAEALGPFLGGPEVPRSGRRDVLRLPGGDVYDLTGNMLEWVRDTYQLQSEPCWSTPGILTDPECATNSPSLGARDTIRGGGWGSGGVGLFAATRGPELVQSANVYTGFRCVLPAE